MANDACTPAPSKYATRSAMRSVPSVGAVSAGPSPVRKTPIIARISSRAALEVRRTSAMAFLAAAGSRSTSRSAAAA